MANNKPDYFSMDMCQVSNLWNLFKEKPVTKFKFPTKLIGFYLKCLKKFGDTGYKTFKR